MKPEMNGKKETSPQEVLFGECRKFIARIQVMDMDVVVAEYKRLKNDVDTMLLTSRISPAEIKQYDSLLKDMYDAVRKEYPDEMDKIDSNLSDRDMAAIRKRTQSQHWKSKAIRAYVQQGGKTDA